MSHAKFTPVAFNFSPAFSVRVVTRDGEPWFVAKDVADALDYTWSGSRISHVPDEWRGVTSVVTPSGTQEMAVLSEPGLYFFLGRSDKPKALPFQKWFASEVLPSIRKTGSYTAQPALPPVRADFDLRAVMMEGNSTPTVPLPAAVQSAINRKAWAMAHDAYELSREHLARRVAYICEVGYHERRLHQKTALAVIAETTLDMALAPQHYNALAAVLRAAESVADHASENLAKMREELKGLPK